MNQTTTPAKRGKVMTIPRLLFKLAALIIGLFLINAFIIYMLSIAIKHVNKMEQAKPAPVVSNSDYLLQ